MKEQCGFAGCNKGATGTHTFSISSVAFPNAVCVSSLCSEHLWANESMENFLLYNELCHTVIAPTVKGQTMKVYRLLNTRTNRYVKNADGGTRFTYEEALRKHNGLGCANVHTSIEHYEESK